MTKIKNLANNLSNLLPIKIESAVYKNQKQGLLKILKEPESEEKKEKILANNRYCAGVMALTTFFDAYTALMFYRSIHNLSEGRYDIGIPGFLGSIGIRAFILYISKKKNI